MQKRVYYNLCIYLSTVFLLVSCVNKHKNALFTQLSSSKSGIHFSNDIHDTDSTNSIINEFGYMGGGVGVGDFNNDGLKDIFFSGNQVSSQMYINKGYNKFEDVTGKAGLTTNVWATGVSIVDINSDGYDDIYLCVYGKNLSQRASNLLFINQHNLTFKEQAEEYGLADSSYSSQAVFFDYDKDGDLDVYLSNYLVTDNNANYIKPRDYSGRSYANDRLYKNEGYSSELNHPAFSDATFQAGIKEDGFGLGVVVSDFNHDNWPDIYVANDFITNDELWLNNKNGTFTNRIDKALRHQSYSSMGADAADINNDGLSDVVTLDMLPEYNDRKKLSTFFMNYERFEAERAMGYEPEYMRNMLHLNNGTYHIGDTAVPFFSEIGQLAGIASTDWSWSVLMADFNNDGWKDIHITNGIGRDFINADFVEFSNNMFASNKTSGEQRRAIRNKLASLEHVNLSNYLYFNRQNYTFKDVSKEAGIDELSMSNGAAYADLDNDGDLDLVVNNINKTAFVFINNTIQQDKSNAHYISIQLKGDSLNTKGFGTKIWLYNKGIIQYQEQNPVRGYFSSVDQQLIFGLGKQSHIDSIVAIWPDDKKQVLINPFIDTIITLSWQKAGVKSSAMPVATHTLFSDITATAGILYKHNENSINDFATQRLLPQKYTQLGPAIATGDINKDGVTDFFVGNGFNFSGKFFMQNKSHSFIGKDLIDSIKMEEDTECALFDADNDSDLDLIIACGDNKYEENSAYYKPRLYRNDGKGNFSLQVNAFPDNVRLIVGSLSVEDYDSDGDKDIFIGGRVSNSYPRPPRSFVLQNNKGIFSDVTSLVSPVLQQPGMITSSAWVDFDNDKQLDLVIAGEWMPIRFFKNKGGRFFEVTNTTGLQQTNGLWRSLAIVDIDSDGDSDIVAGNLGLNCIYRVTKDEPMQLFAKDLDGNGSIDPIFFYYIKDKDGTRRLFPAISRSQFAEQVPAIKKQFLYTKDYSKATFDDIFNGKQKEGLLNLSCDETRSCYFENIGNGKFVKHVLPIEAQFAPVNAILCEDFNNDGNMDLLLAGNEYQADVITGRYDASYGCFLKGNSKKSFQFVPLTISGFKLNGDIKDMALIQSVKGEKMILVAVNNDSLRVFKIGD
jgi:enediyne biosynthesis protein E4